MNGVLHVVSTPIGHLEDLSPRARRVLESVDLVAAEDTRHTGRMLQQLGLSVSLTSLHEHNELRRSEQLLQRLRDGASLALVSDAGTPLISDPGFRLVRLCHEHGIRVSPVPGPSAVLAALAVAGLPTDRFLFEGFPPSRGAARDAWIRRVASESLTVVIYESPRRMPALLEALGEAGLAEREAVLCRELTKRFETVLRGTPGELLQALEADPDQQRGEMVLLLAGAPEQDRGQEELQRLGAILCQELSVSRAAKVLAAWSGRPRRELYDMLEALDDRA